MRKISVKGLTKIQSVIVGAVIVVALVGGFWYYWSANTGKVVLKVFCAGSLTLPFEDIKAQFEADQSNVEVQLEPSGSVTCVQKITELGEECDVLASADYTLIPSMMMTSDSHYTDWYIIFAVNRMTIAYTNNSRYADEINSTNWYQILRRSDVKWGFSNPNMDPCGYRSPVVLQLAEFEYGDDMIFEDLIEANSDITVSEADGTYTIDANMTDLNPNTERLMIRDKSVDLVTFVQEGGLDYAFEYSSVAKQHELIYLELPETIDLSSVGCKDLYETVKIRKTTTISTGEPIVYGLTIPNNAPNPTLAEEFVNYIINEFGQSVLLGNAQPPVVPAITNDVNEVPESLKAYVVEQEEESFPELPEMSLTLVALNGTEIVLDNNSIAKLPAVEYKGGLMTSAGSIGAVGIYTGVPITTLCDLVSGLTNETSLRVTASDGYSMVFTYDQIMGDFVTFDPATGDEVGHSEPLIMVLAYFFNGEPLSSKEGPLRLVVVGPEGLITEGHNWVKFVEKMEIRPALRDWTLTLEGFLTEEMDRATFEAGANCHSANWTDDDGNTWSGISLWLLVGRVDDANPHSHETPAFNRTLADEGYIVKVIASDGYQVEFNSTLVKLNDNILVVNEMNDMPLPEKYWPLKLVGSDLSKTEMIRNIVKIKIVFGNNWNLTLNGTLTEVMTRDFFESGADCHPASWTDDEGRIWTGVPLWLLVGRIDDSLQHGTDAFNRTLADQGYIIRLIAADGYTMDLNSTFVKLNNNIIVSNEMNNMPLPEKYWPLRLVSADLTKSQMIRNIVEIQIIFEG